MPEHTDNTENAENTDNTPRRDSAPMSCTESPCTSYGPGHNLHFIQARFVGGTPWGWRDAVLQRVEDGWLHLSYLDTPAHPILWHHADLTDVLSPGAPVRLHEQYHVLGSPAGWSSVVIHQGVGAVPEPAHPNLWRAEMTAAVVDNRTGRALPLDHLDPGAAG